MLFIRALGRTDQPVSGLSRPPGKAGLQKRAPAKERRPNGGEGKDRIAKGRLEPKHGDQGDGERGHGLRDTAVRGSGVRACVVHPIAVRTPGRSGIFRAGPKDRRANGGTEPRNGRRTTRIGKTGKRTSGLATGGEPRRETRPCGTADTGVRVSGVRNMAACRWSQSARPCGPKGRNPGERTTSARRPKDREARVRRPHLRQDRRNGSQRVHWFVR